MEKLPENFGKKDIPDINKGIERATNKINQEIKSQREAGIPDEEISASAEGKINIPKLSKEPKEEKREKEKKKEQPSKTENKKEKTVEDYVQEDIDKAKKIFDDKSLDFQKQVALLKEVGQHLSKLNLSPEKINLRKLTKMTPEELNEWLNAVKIITKPEVQEQLNKPETKTLLRQGVEVLQKSDKEKSQEKPPAWLAKAKETAKLGGWALGAGVGIFAIIAFLLLSLGLDKLLNIGGGGKKK